MKTIWKYFINPIGFEWKELPIGAQIVSVGQDCGGAFCFWAIVDPGAETESRAFWFGGTGWDIPEGFEYLGMVREDPYIWHFGEIHQQEDETR